jgi:hypothetical protein
MLGMAITLAELAADLCVDPGEILVLVGAYPPEETGAWEEEGILSNIAAGDVRDMLDHFGERTVPALWWPENPGQESLPPA